MKVKCTIILLLSIFGSQIAHAQSGGIPGSNVVVAITGSGTLVGTFNYGNGRIDYITNHISANLQFHPYSPQVNGYYYASSVADFSGSVTINATAVETAPGTSYTDGLNNTLNYDEPDYAVATEFFGPQFFTGNGTSLAGDVASLDLTPPTTGGSPPLPTQLSYSGTNGELTVWISFPSPFQEDTTGWPIPCTVNVSSNGSTIQGTVLDASMGNPLAGATAKVGGQTFICNANGEFLVPLTPPGPLTIQITDPGYQTYQVTRITPPFSAIQQTFKLTNAPLVVVDANPLFLNGTLLPQPITSTLLAALQSAPTTRNVAAADGITKLLLMVRTFGPGTVVFSQSGGVSGTFSNVDGSTIPSSGVPTVSVGGQQMAFALYTVPDQTSPGGANVSLNASFQAQGTTTQVPLTPWPLQLIQTPVVLVHGLWGWDGTTWNSMLNALTKANITATKADYAQLFASGPFSTYSGIVVQQVEYMLDNLRTASSPVAVTRADVVAHSMGGILTRMDANNQDYYRPDNFNAGPIRRVITVDTPHWGATPAQFLLDLAHDRPAFDNIPGHPIIDGAVQDLSPYTFAALSGGAGSAARQSLNLPSCAISCRALNDTDFDLLLSALYGDAKVNELFFLTFNPSYQVFFQNLLCGQMLALGDDDMAIAGKLFFGNFNDGVVGMSSQEGGCASVLEFADIDHMNAPGSPVIQNAIIQLLQGPVSAFSAAGFPAVSPADLNSQICNSAPSSNMKGLNPLGKSPSPKLQLSLITLTSPQNGSTALPGTQITMQAQPVTNTSVQEVDFFVTSGNNQVVAWGIVTNAPFTNIITVPTNLLGPLTITAVGQDAQGDYDIEQSTIEILPESGLTLQSISVHPTNLTFSELTTPQTLELTGLYSDGVTRDITLGGAGTSYGTSTPSVAVVDQNGKVSAVGNGSAQITVTNGGMTVQVQVQVGLQQPQILSIQPNSLQPGISNVNVIMTGLNLGGTTNIIFLRNGQIDKNLTAGSFVLGANAANIQAQISVASNTAPGLINVVVMTPVGSSAQMPVQGNRFFIGQPLVCNNLGFTNLAGSGGFGFTVVGSTGSSCIIQTSTDLINWSNEVTNTLTFGSFNFAETNAPTSARFYRVELLP